MRMRRIVLGAALVLALAACGGDDDEAATATEDTAAADTATSDTAADDTATDDTAAADTATDTGTAAAGGDTTTAADGATVAVASSDLGDILVDAEGRTLYVFDNDEPGVSNCTEGCLDAWPPLAGEPTAGDGVDAALLDTIERDDGTTQVTIDGSPLYYYAADQAPGDTTGQGVGGVWWVADPSGARITTDTGS